MHTYKTLLHSQNKRCSGGNAYSILSASATKLSSPFPMRTHNWPLCLHTVRGLRKGTSDSICIRNMHPWHASRHCTSNGMHNETLDVKITVQALTCQRTCLNRLCKFMNLLELGGGSGSVGAQLKGRHLAGDRLEESLSRHGEE